MSAGFFAAACLTLMLGQSANDVSYSKSRELKIPLTIQESARTGIREVVLYVSGDKGRSWQPAATVAPSKSQFVYYAPSDGMFGFQVAFVNQQGVQVPDEKTVFNSPPHQIIVVDTQNPIMKSFRAERHGDEIHVGWDIQEDHPDLTPQGFRLEYMAKDALIEKWVSIPLQPNLQWRMSFRPESKQTLIVRLSVRDRAGNQSYSVSEVPGIVVASYSDTPRIQGEGVRGPADKSGVQLGSNITPVVKEDGLPKPPVGLNKLPTMPPPIDPEPVNAGSKGLPGVTLPPPPQMKEKTVVQKPDFPPMPESLKPLQRDPMTSPLPLVGEGSGVRGTRSNSDSSLDLKSLAGSSGPSRNKPLPLLQHVNRHQVMMQYKLNRIGPSGISAVEVWLTKDDGETWERFAEERDSSVGPVNLPQERSIDLRDQADRPFADGIYGFALVVKNRAGMGKTPRPGDVPEIRVEIDTKPPEIDLFQPVTDPQHPDQLLIRWSARDKNLGTNPVHLDFAEKREGPWTTIKTDLENTGRYVNQRVTGDYSWKVPNTAPVQVYLRLRVTDRAGNESTFVTADPQFIDLVEPEGALIGIQPQQRK